MDSKTNKLVNRSAWTAIFLFLVRYFLGFINVLDFLKCENWYDYLGAAGEAVSVATVLLIIYDKWFWKYNPLDSTPRLMGSYTGIIAYNYNGQNQTKITKVIIDQTSLKIRVKITTDEITSNTITSNLIKENDEYVLYYTYITNPNSQHSAQNPMQHGTCRLVQTDKDKLEGQYWTSRQTIGDIKLTR